MRYKHRPGILQSSSRCCAWCFWFPFSSAWDSGSPSFPPRKRPKRTATTAIKKRAFPWLAILFIICVGINSLGIIPNNVAGFINSLDIFLLTMAMCALGMETSIEKTRIVAPKPFLLAGVLAVWLMVGGYWISKFMTDMSL
jgi:uncharacterized membrane protein YadS